MARVNSEKAQRLSELPPAPSTELPLLRRQLGLFARNFFRHPRMLGSLIPSSRYLVRRLLDQVKWDQADVIVEYGPGVGTFTLEILHRMGPHATLLAFETNEEFVRFLQSAVVDPRFRVIHASAANATTELRKLGKRANYVISGIPFRLMSDEARAEVLEATREILHPRGAFLVYQFSRAIQPLLRRTFQEVDASFEPLNVLPAWVYRCSP